MNLHQFYNDYTEAQRAEWVMQDISKRDIGPIHTKSFIMSLLYKAAYGEELNIEDYINSELKRINKKKEDQNND